MSKPIVVIRIPDNYFGGMDDQHGRRHLSESFNKDRQDYYWFMLPQPDPMGDIIFEVFYEKDHQPISFEELYQLISDSIKQDKP